MEYIKAAGFFLGSLLIATFGYFESIAFSTALPMPDIVKEYTDLTGNPSNAYYWSFIVVTLNLPFSILAAICGFLSGRFTYFWVASAAFAVSLVYLRGLALGTGHWWSVFLMALFVCILLALVGRQTRNK
jgi:hypothetical protein